MKTNKKLMMTLMLALLLPVTAVALPPYDYTNYEFAVDGIYYKIVDNEACVTFQQYSSGMHISDYHGDVVIPAQVTYRDVTYPVTTIDYYAFNYCQGLTSITIPESITTIKDCAFYLCTGLTSVNLLSPTVTIENNAFAECRALTTITCTSTTPPAMYNENCFDSPHYQNATLHVPASAVESYRNAPVWKKFVHIIGDATTETPDNEDGYEYVPFVREGVKWVYYITNFGDFYPANPHYPKGTTYYTLEIKGDTVINGKVYKAMHKYYGSSINWANDTVPVFLREEDKVVYGIVPDGRQYYDCPLSTGEFSGVNPYNGNEYVLYDFNNPEEFWSGIMNDCFNDGRYTPFGTDTITVGHRKVKRHIAWVGEVSDYNKMYSIESIGFDSWRRGTPISYYMVGFTESSVAYFFSHVIEDGEIIYKSVNYKEPEPETTDYEYVPFVREGVKWVCFYESPFGEDGELVPKKRHYYTLELKGDTVIDGKHYKPMHLYSGAAINENSDTVPVYLREENKVVYAVIDDNKYYDECPIAGSVTYDFFNPEQGKEKVLYDFSEQSYPYFLGLDHIDKVVIGNHLRKRFVCNDSWLLGRCFIEGIGFAGGEYAGSTLCFNHHEPTEPHVTHWLSHVIEDGEIIYTVDSWQDPAVEEDDDYLPLVREGVKWVNERVIVNNGDTTRYYYNYEFSGMDTLFDEISHACYYYLGDKLNVEQDSLIAGLRDESSHRVTCVRNNAYIPLEENDDVIFLLPIYTYGDTRKIYDFSPVIAPALYLNAQNFWWEIGERGGQALTEDNFIEVEPVEIEGVECSRFAFLGDDGEPLAYVVEGIGFDSRDMGDLLTPFTRRPDPNADHQEWCGLSHVIKDGKIIYKGMRYNPNAVAGLPGDVNGDGEINIADADSVIDIVILGGNAGHTRIPAADMNGDGEIDIADVNAIINKILKVE